MVTPSAFNIAGMVGKVLGDDLRERGRAGGVKRKKRGKVSNEERTRRRKERARKRGRR